MISFAQSYILDPRAKVVWSDESTLQRWLDVEAALARAQCEIGIVPPEAASRIEECARVELFDLAALSRAIAVAQHPLMPVLHDFIALCGPASGAWLHWGATTQNILDTAQAIQLRDTLALLEQQLAAVIGDVKRLAAEHVETLQAGRTHGQHALPITFGYKLASWVVELQRHADALTRLRGTACVARMGGAVGTYAAMKGRGSDVESRVARHFGLATPVIGGRSDCAPQVEYVAFLGMLAATCERIADDTLFMQRTEVGELEELHYEGRVGSSTMAQKRNPHEAQRILMLARLIRSRVPLALDSMVRAQEGDAVQAHLLDHVLPEVSVFAASMLSALASHLSTVRVRPDVMLRNLAATGGLIMAESVMMELAQQIGRDAAHRLVQRAASESLERGIPFLDALRQQAPAFGLEPESVPEAALFPQSHLGECVRIVQTVTGRT